MAYSGITARATAASITSDLDSASKQLKLYQVDNSSYPTSLDCSNSPVAGSICLKSSTGTNYSTYSPNNTTSPQSYCLTATNGGVNYTVNQATTPTSGACSITNLVANPGLEVDGSGWQGYGISPNISRITTSAHSGVGSLQLAPTGSGYQGAQFYISVTPNVPDTFSAYVLRQSGSGGASIVFEWRDSSGVYISQTGNVTIPAAIGSWSRVSTTAVAPANAYYAYLIIRYTGAVANSDIMLIDDVMMTSGPMLYTYADGSLSSSGWAWNGTANASTSTGPPL